MKLLFQPITQRQLYIETGISIVLGMLCLAYGVYNILHGGPIDTDNPSDTMLYGAFQIMLGIGGLGGTIFRYREFEKHLFGKQPK